MWELLFHTNMLKAQSAQLFLPLGHSLPVRRTIFNWKKDNDFTILDLANFVSYRALPTWEFIDNMLVHLAVPVNSSLTCPSRPTSTFCNIYVAQYFCDFTNYECSIAALATQRENGKMFHVSCRSALIQNILYSDSIGEKHDGNLYLKSSCTDGTLVT